MLKPKVRRIIKLIIVICFCYNSNAQSPAKSGIQLNDTMFLVGRDTIKIKGPGSGRYVTAKTYNELRQLKGADTATIFRTIINGFVSDFYWSPNSTAKDDSVMVIKLNDNPTGRLLRHFENYILVDWFGAVPNDANDDSRSIQKALDFAITSTKAPEVRFLGGNYYANNLNIVRKSGSEYSFVTLRIKGQSLLVGQATTIFVNNVNGFGFHIMLGRQVEISNISFVGQGPSPSANQVVTWSDAQWTNGVRNNRHSPHAAIVIDGYFSAISSSDQYPGMSANYTNSRTGGTSMVMITHCSFKKFVVGVMENPSGSVANGDNVKVEHSYFESNKIAWACGQTQSRANTMENCYLTFTQTVVDGVTYGAQNGTPPLVSRCNFAGMTKYLYSANGGFGTLTFNGCYAESLYAFGKNGGTPVLIADCDILLNTDNVIFAAPHFAEGDQLTFRGGKFGYFDNLNNMVVPFAVKNLSFNGVLMLCTPVNMHQNVFSLVMNKTVFDNSRFIGTGQVGEVWEANVYNGIEFTNAFGNSPVIMPGTKYIYTDQNQRLQFESKSPKIDVAYIETNTLKIDPATATAYFKTTAPGAYQLNDILTTSLNITWAGDNGLFYATPTILGEVYSISGDTIRLKYVPYGLNQTTSYPIIQVHIPHFVPKFFGDVTKGSNIISNCRFGLLTPLVGDWLKSDHLPAGTRITKIAGTTVTVSRNAASTIAGVDFNDAAIFIEAKAASVASVTNVMGFSVGDVIINSRVSAAYDSVAYWICSSAGFTGSSPLAKFTYVKAGPGTGSNSGTEDYSADANYTVAPNITDVELIDRPLTANRTITLPAASIHGQRLTIITRYSPGKNHYILSSAVTDNSTGSTFTQLDWGKTYDFYVNSNTKWLLIRKY
jgi:hypothetical protein